MVAGVSGVLRRDVGVQIDHALRRWLIWTGRAGYGTDDYVGDPCACNGFIERKDKRVSLGSRHYLQVQPRALAQGRIHLRSQLHSNVEGGSYTANVFLVGLKLQR